MSIKLRLYHRDLGKPQREVKTSDLSSSFSTRPAVGAYSIFSSQNEHKCESTDLHGVLEGWPLDADLRGSFASPPPPTKG